MGAFHGKVLSALPEVDIVAVVDERDEARAAAADLPGGHVTMASVDELGASNRVEAWLVAASTPSHPSLVRTGLRAGVHVLCEKPLALDADESDALGRAAAEALRVLQVGFWRRFAPPWAVARRLIRDGAIGRPLLVRLSQWDADPPPAEFCDPAVSGGLAVDCGVHEFDLAEWLTGLAITAVQAQALPLVDAALGSAGDVDNLFAALDLADGAVATVDLSRNARYGDDVRTEILGSDGAIFVDLLPTGRTRLATRAGVSVVAGSEVDDAMAAGVAAQTQAFVEAVRSHDVAGIPDAAASSRAVRVARAVDEAIRTGSKVSVG